jgi:NADH-quinone oxidoreductase subunit I
MDGSGILQALGVTFRRIAETFLDDIKWGKKRYHTEEGIAHRMSKDARGIFTVQYPEEKLPVPEEFRYIPFLVYEEKDEGKKDYRCTACGICAKVCPPQCIWIERGTNPKTGRPVPNPEQFFIDVDICMNCGLCVEFCPFDAIIMDHDYELSVQERFDKNIYNIDKLGKPVSYYASIRPSNYAEEMAAKRKADEDFKKEQEEKKRRERAQEKD